MRAVMAEKPSPNYRVVAENRRARHDYQIEDDLESSQVHVLLVPRALPPPPDAAA